MSIDTYNQEILEWDFENEKLESFLEVLIDRNKQILKEYSRTDFSPEEESFVNESFVDLRNSVSEEYFAFHVGYPNQRRLHSLVDEETGLAFNKGVFFSLSPEDVRYYLNPEKPESMIYFLDVSVANGIKVQNSYESSVISRRDLEELVGIKDEEKIKKQESLNTEWIKKNTEIFELDKLDDYKEKKHNWLIVPDPILVNYE
jgi:hypothetical protein